MVSHIYHHQSQWWAVSHHCGLVECFLPSWMHLPCCCLPLSSLPFFCPSPGLWEALVHRSRREWMLPTGWARAVSQMSHRPCQDDPLSSRELGTPSRPCTQFSSPPCLCPVPLLEKGRLLPTETMPAQFSTHVGVTAARLHSAYPPRKDLSSHLSVAIRYSRSEGMLKVESTISVLQDSGRERPGLHQHLVEVVRKTWWQALQRAEHSSVPRSQE